MTVPKEAQSWIAKGDFDALEDAWLARAESHSEDLDYFVGIARALVGHAQDDRARFLLDVLDEQLREKERWETRLTLLRRAGQILLPDDKLHPAILATLKRIYADHLSAEGLIDAAGLHKATHDIPKTWEKVDRFTGLIAYDVGAVVLMESRGAGRVAEVNLELESFKIDFEGFPGLTVGFRAAAKLLKPLVKGHVLRRKMDEPEVLKALVKDDPSELLRIVLASYDRPLSAGEIRQDLAGIVEDKGWTSWWGKARKHPQVLAGAGSRQSYRWAESSDDALDALWQRFNRAEVRQQMDILRKEGSRDKGLAGRMMKVLSVAAATAEPGLAWEIWFTLERAGGAPENVPWSPEALLDQVTPRDLFPGIEDRLLRERGYTMLRERNPDWPDLFLDLLRHEQDPRALALLAKGARKERPADFGRFLDDLLTRPHRTPGAFVWLAEAAAEDEELRSRNPLRLMQQIFTCIGRDEFATWRVRLGALVESGSTIPRILPHLEEADAAKAQELIHRAPTLESYQREQLENALHLRFASLREEESDILYALASSIEAKREELRKLLEEEIPTNRKAIEEAREMGDLRENFEYHAARNRHEYLSAISAKLSQDLARAQPIGLDSLGTSEMRVGNRARLRGPSGGERSLAVLGPWESDPDQDVISYQSDLGQALLGARPGEEVEIAGERFTLESIEVWS